MNGIVFAPARRSLAALRIATAFGSISMAGPATAGFRAACFAWAGAVCAEAPDAARPPAKNASTQAVIHSRCIFVSLA